MIHGQPRVLFVALTDDVGSERIVSEMGRRGAVCAVAAPPDAIAARSLRVSHHLRLPGRGGPWMAALALARRLEGAAAGWRPDAVVPLDDMAAATLCDLWTSARTGPALRLLLDRSFGDSRHAAAAGNRALLIETAEALGCRVPAQRSAVDLAAARAAAAEIGYPLMVKREGTCGGGGIVLARDDAGLVRAFRSAAIRARGKRALQALFGFRPGDGAAITLQAHVAGRLALRTVACDAGRVLDGVSLAALHLDPPVTGSSTVVRPIDHPEMDDTARRLVAALGRSGFVSFDFILSEDGNAHLIEMNARPVGSGHLGARFGHDVYGAWLQRFPGFVDADPPHAAEPWRTVALFPKELRRDPASQHLADPDVLHDLPWDEPAVVSAYRERLARHHPGRATAVARHFRPDGEPDAALVARP